MLNDNEIDNIETIESSDTLGQLLSFAFGVILGVLILYTLGQFDSKSDDIKQADTPAKEFKAS